MKRQLAVASVVAAALVCAATALASGSFTWTASFNTTLRSRDYSTPNTGSHHISSFMNCHNDQNSRSYQIEVSRNRTALPDVGYGQHTYGCGVTDASSWSIGDTGTFHFTLSKIFDGITWDGNGTTSYP
jgi:hypothetical protein